MHKFEYLQDCFIYSGGNYTKRGDMGYTDIQLYISRMGDDGWHLSQLDASEPGTKTFYWARYKQPTETPIEPESEFKKAVRNLVLMAQTSGGTAGKDEKLMKAIDDVAKFMEPQMDEKASPEKELIIQKLNDELPLIVNAICDAIDRDQEQKIDRHSGMFFEIKRAILQHLLA